MDINSILASLGLDSTTIDTSNSIWVALWAGAVMIWLIWRQWLRD